MNLGPLQKAMGKGLDGMLKLVEDTLHQDAYSKTDICKILELSNEEDLFKLCHISDHVRNYGSFELYKRAMHVFGEAKRVYDFKGICDDNQTSMNGTNSVKDELPLAMLGQLMFASHESCDNMYDCSHPQLNTLVNLSKKHGALGARYGGFKVIFHPILYNIQYI